MFVLGAVPVLLWPGPGVPGLLGSQIAPIPSRLVPLQGECLDPGFCILSPCTQLWLSSSPCLDETLSAIKTDTEKAHWTTCNILLIPFLLLLGALIQPVLFCATLHLPNQRTLNRGGGHFIHNHCQGGRTTCCTTGFTELSCVLPYYEQTLKGNYSWCQPLGDILCLFVTL